MIGVVSEFGATGGDDVIGLDKVRAVRDLWHRCGQFSALEADDAMICFLDGMGELVGAQSGYWTGAASGKEFQPALRSDLFEGYESVDYLAMGGEERLAGVRSLQNEYLRVATEYGICPLAEEAISQRGVVRGVIRRDVISDESWEAHWLREVYYEPNGIVDRFFAIYPVDDQAESVVVFDRRGGAEPFGAEDREFLLLAVCGIGQLHRELMLNRGGVRNADRLLTPREIDVLKQVLTGDTEKEIAEVMGMGKSTLHHHVLSIYRKFGVRNRAGLQALWGRR